MDISPGEVEGVWGGSTVGGRKRLSESHMIPATIWVTNLTETLWREFFPVRWAEQTPLQL